MPPAGGYSAAGMCPPGRIVSSAACAPTIWKKLHYIGGTGARARRPVPPFQLRAVFVIIIKGRCALQMKPQDHVIGYEAGPVRYGWKVTKTGRRQQAPAPASWP